MMEKEEDGLWSQEEEGDGGGGGERMTTRLASRRVGCSDGGGDDDGSFFMFGKECSDGCDVMKTRSENQSNSTSNCHSKMSLPYPCWKPMMCEDEEEAVQHSNRIQCSMDPHPFLHASEDFNISFGCRFTLLLPIHCPLFLDGLKHFILTTRRRRRRRRRGQRAGASGRGRQ